VSPLLLFKCSNVKAQMQKFKCKKKSNTTIQIPKVQM
jgi:hypothetical protein